MRLLLALLSLLTLGSAALSAQPEATPPDPAAKPLEAEERRTVLSKLAQELEDRFVFPEVAKAYATMLRDKLKSGAYDAIDNARVFASKVTADLQEVSKDGHLRLMLGSGELGRRRMPGRTMAEGLEETKMIGDVAYLRFNSFPESVEVARRARDFLKTNAGQAKAVIIDSRPNGGGSLLLMDAMLPLLFEKQTELVRMDTRAAAAAGGPLADSATLVRRPSPETVVRRDHIVIPDTGEKRLQKVPVFYLTSKRTGSAAEHLALAFKRTGRATLVGETTGGAGHFGGVVRFGERFSAFIPVGRTYDAATDRGWEGTGVAPDVAVPADAALDEALRRANATKAP